MDFCLELLSFFSFLFSQGEIALAMMPSTFNLEDPHEDVSSVDLEENSSPPTQVWTLSEILFY